MYYGEQVKKVKRIDAHPLEQRDRVIGDWRIYPKNVHSYGNWIPAFAGMECKDRYYDKLERVY